VGFGLVTGRVWLVQVVVVLVVVVAVPTIEAVVSVPDVVVVLTVAVEVTVEPVAVAVLVGVVVDVTVEFDLVTVLSGSVVTRVIVVVVVPPLTRCVVVLCFVTVVVLVTLHRRVKWFRVPGTRCRRHLAGTVLGPLPAERATPTGTSSTTVATRTPNDRIRELRLMASPWWWCRRFWSTSRCQLFG
jgi:hypothetical protein